jgi:hypothetical protein
MYEGLLGNKNAEKYTESDVTTLLVDISNKARKENCYFILQAIKHNISKAQFDYFTVKYKDNKTVFGIIKAIQSICECNLVEAMLTGKVKETASIFLLKAKYGYIDKQVIETEQKGSINITLQMPEDTPIPH